MDVKIEYKYNYSYTCKYVSSICNLINVSIFIFKKNDKSKKCILRGEKNAR